jgi:hypothetical protein
LKSFDGQKRNYRIFSLCLIDSLSVVVDISYDLNYYASQPLLGRALEMYEDSDGDLPLK